MGAESEYKGISPTIICDIERIIGVVERTKERYGHGCAVLLGAGCSATAQIPMAATFVEWIETDFNQEYFAACKVCLTRERAKPNYFDCMEQLPDGDQADLIRRAMEDARMNWAHIALAQLMETGHVDRVLTTNFDPLIVKACALLNFFPAVYDIAASSDFVPSAVADSAVFYLHGQSTGWKLLNRLDESGELTDRIRDVVKEVIGDRPLIVVGYNGAEDPVCRALFELRSYRRGLYWIGYNSELPDNYVISNILKPAKSARFLTSSGADSFFVTLARKLSSFPPSFVEAPFTHLQDLLSKIQDFSDEKGTVDVLDQTRRWIQSAIMRFEIGEEDASETRDTLQEDKLAAEAMTAYASGDYDKAVSFLRNITARKLTQGEINAFTWSYIGIGNALYDKAKTKQGKEADELWTQAYAKYAEAVKIKPDKHEVLNNWGNALGAQAKTKQGKEADELWTLAYAKYVEAVKIMPDFQDSFYNWGSALHDQANTKQGEEADELWTLAYAKYAEAVKIKPDKHEALNNWGNALSNQANTKQGKEADELWTLAYAKYAEAVKIKPDKHEAFNNWGSALATQAKTKQGKEADEFWTLAYDNYAEAVKIKPDKHEAFYNWGIALSNQANTKQGKEADELWTRAYAKYAEAIKIKPDKHEALYKLGNALSDQAKTKQGKEADELWTQGYAKYAEAAKTKPDGREALSNWANALCDQAKTKQGKAADELWTQAYAKYAEAVKIKPDKHEALYNWGNALSDQAKTKQGKEADELWTQAYAKYAEAVKIKPDKHEVLNNWGNALGAQAKTKQGKEADELWTLAYAKYVEAVKIMPDFQDSFYNWGSALHDQANTKQGEEADELWTLAYAKYAEAVKIKPDKHEAFNNWGVALAAQGKQNPDRKELLTRALGFFQRGETVKRGSCAYNLACLYSMQNDVEKTVEWLQVARETNSGLDCKMIAQDLDFDAVRDATLFRDFVSSLPDDKAD